MNEAKAFATKVRALEKDEQIAGEEETLEHEKFKGTVSLQQLTPAKRFLRAKNYHCLYEILLYYKIRVIFSNCGLVI